MSKLINSLDLSTFMYLGMLVLVKPALLMKLEKWKICAFASNRLWSIMSALEELLCSTIRYRPIVTKLLLCTTREYCETFITESRKLIANKTAVVLYSRLVAGRSNAFHGVLQLNSQERIQIRRVGWALLEGVFSRAIISELKKMILGHIEAEGLVDGDGVFSIERRGEFYEGSALFNQVYSKIQQSLMLHEFKHSEEVLSLSAKLLNTDKLFVHPNITVRICPPWDGVTDHSTVSHQDYFNIQGSKETLTLWIPLDDYSEEDGVLAVSDRPGEQILKIGIDSETCKTRLADEHRMRWYSRSFRAGDVLVFDALTPHKALKNCGVKTRLSLDIRVQKVTENICKSSLVPVGMGKETFEEFSRAYFKGRDIVGSTEDLSVVGRDADLDSIKYELIFKEAERKNPNMKALLQRIRSFSHDESYRERAKNYLKLEVYR